MSTTTFHPVNTSLAPELPSRNGEDTTPTTPRPSTAPNLPPPPMNRTEDSTTPTRANFGAMTHQRPLPSTPFSATPTASDSGDDDTKSVARGDASNSGKSRGNKDVDMDNSDEGEDGGSDDESVDADGTRSGKKKKSQRFYCTEYPPCNLSFTRSEHLARHIRKHTGERPFQCHCARRFSRLDNLRQHAQTVHVNEEIPGNSLAATGTRFQRQVRTDRVRPPGSRSRASTSGSSGPVCGHQRNSLSASSITSMGSTISQGSDIRRRPAPLVMAGDPRARYSQEMYPPESPPPQYQQYHPHSPGGFSTPASATFSGQNSPRWNSGMHSPASSHSRGHSQSIYGSGHRTPGRRLSVPSSGNPFQSPHSSVHPPLLSSMGSNNGNFSPSSSVMGSPATSTSGSVWSRRDSIDEGDWRRRTWHPESSMGFTSRLQQVTTPNYYSNGPPPKPSSIVPSNAPPLPPMRLPGIESFDPLHRPVSSPRRNPSPMMVDTLNRARPLLTDPFRDERPASSHWDTGLQGNMNRLDIAHTPPTDNAGSWATETQRAVQSQAENSRRTPSSVRFEHSAYSRPGQPRAFHQHTISAPIMNTKENRRQGWYHGPIVGQATENQRTSPESNSSEGNHPHTPGSAALMESNPSIVHANGYIETRAPLENRPIPANAPNVFTNYQPANGPNVYTYPHRDAQNPISPHQHQIPKTSEGNMSKLDALVAVATSKENITAAY